MRQAAIGDWHLAKYQRHPILQRPSRTSPVAGCDFLAYSCAAARDLHPLPCLCRAAKTRKPKDMSKSENNSLGNLMAANGAVNYQLSTPDYLQPTSKIEQ
jgi:hypothetical protein